MEPAAETPRRSRAIVLAVLTSLVSKGGNLLLMLLGLRLAMQELGPDRFAIYGLLQSMMFLVFMADLGLGPGMVRQLAGAAARGDRRRQGEVMATGLAMVLGLTALVAGIGALLLWQVPVTTLFGAGFAPHADELRTAAWVALGVFSLLMVLFTLDRAREGLQQVHVSNGFGAACNVTAALLLVAGLPRWPSVIYVVLAVYGVQAVFLMVNAAHLLATRPWLAPLPGRIDRRLGRRLALESAGLFLAGFAVPVIEREVPKYLLGHVAGPAAVTDYTLLAQLGLFGFGFVLMFTRPLGPACADAASRGDWAWLDGLRRRVHRLALPAGLFLAGGFWLCGPTFTALWMGKGTVAIPRSAFGLYGMVFALAMWAHLHYVMLGNTGRIRPAAVIMAVDALAVIGLSAAGMAVGGLNGALAGAALGSLLVSAWLLPRVRPAAAPDPADAFPALTPPVASQG